MASKERMRKINSEIDSGLEKANLLDKLAAQDSAIANAIEADRDRDAQKAEQRRQLLLARRRNRNKQAVEEERVKQKLDIIQEE